MKLLAILLLVLLSSGSVLFWVLSNKENSVDFDKYEKVMGTIISANVYQKKIKTELRSLNSGIPQTNFDERWKLTVSYSYTVNRKTYFGSQSLLSNDGIIGIIKKNKPEDLFEKLKDNVAGKQISVFYEEKNLAKGKISLND